MNPELPELTDQETTMLIESAMRAKQISELAAQYQKEAEGSARDVSTTYKTIMQMKGLNADAFQLSINSETKTAVLVPIEQPPTEKPDLKVMPDETPEAAPLATS